MNENLLSQLERLAKLKEQGVLTEEELQQQKAQLMNSIAPIPPEDAAPKSEVMPRLPKPVAHSAKSGNGPVVAFCVFLAMVFVVMYSLGSKKDKAVYGSNSDLPLTTDTTLSRPSNLTHAIESASPVVVAKTKWDYFDFSNAMDGKEYQASITADDLLTFDFPYNGGSEAILTVRKKRGSTDILLKVSKGQFINSYNDDSYVRVKFDGKPTTNYTISRASDGSSDVIFIDSPKRLIAGMRKAESMIIEAEFYNEGRRQISFEVKGFKWSH